MTRWLCSLSTFGWLNAQQDSQLPGAASKSPVSKTVRNWTIRVVLLTVVLWLLRPALPYRHMTGALPFIMLGPFGSSARSGSGNHEFPGSQVSDEDYLGVSDTEVGYGEDALAWARAPLPAGFERWAYRLESNATDTGNSTDVDEDFEEDAEEEEEYNYYDRTKDPMRVSNVDLGLLQPMQAALKDRDVPITHVVLVFLESGRKDLFPLKSGSRLHQQINETYEANDVKGIAELNRKLSTMTRVAEKLTGEESGFDPIQPHENTHAAGPDMGGISVDGALSGSSLSSKARLVNYCGVGPLPVDFMPETSLMPYQPCLMHIMNLFNQRKNATANSTTNDTLERQWQTIYAQSVTGEFKDQTELIKLMGFNESLYSEDINTRRAKYFREGMEQINYFG